MEDRAPYWQQITLTSGGDLRRQAQSEAQAFIEHWAANLAPEAPSARDLQHYLMQAYGSASPNQVLAEACLRNFITHKLHQRAATLANRFGQGSPHPSHPQALTTHTPFTAIELFCCVFAPPRSSPTDDTDPDFYDPGLTTKILTTFDPEKGGLASWCITCFDGNRVIKRFLREHGVLLVTDWQLLCRTSLGKLKRLLTAVDCTSGEIEANLQLLTAFHQVYRTQLLEQRRTHPSRRPYPAPNEQQLTEMCRGLSPSPDLPTLSNRLKDLAQYVRQARCRGPSPRKTSTAPATAPNEEIKKLLDEYCAPCLKQAVEHTLDQRLETLKQKRRGATKADQFLHALKLFYCDSLPMKEIAPAVGLRDQPSVTRLLQREKLKADIRRQVLAGLLQQVHTLATENKSLDCLKNVDQSPQDLQALDQQIADYLEPYVERIIAADQREGYTSKHRQMTSAYATQLCRCATARRKPS